MITGALVIALVLFTIVLWYYSTYLAQLNMQCAELEFRLKFYQIQCDWGMRYQALVLHGERQLSGQRSKISGKILEQYCPFAPEYVYDPDDSVAVFDVVDYIVFKGKSINQIDEIIVQEMKSSLGASLSPRQKQIQNCIQAGRVKFEMWRLDRATGKWHLHIPREKNK